MAEFALPLPSSVHSLPSSHPEKPLHQLAAIHDVISLELLMTESQGEALLKRLGGMEGESR